MSRVFMFSILAGKQQQHVTRCLEKQCITLLSFYVLNVWRKLFSVSADSEFTQDQKMSFTVSAICDITKVVWYVLYFQVVTPARYWSRPLKLSIIFPP